jgi:hypothetical protein
MPLSAPPSILAAFTTIPLCHRTAPYITPRSWRGARVASSSVHGRGDLVLDLLICERGTLCVHCLPVRFLFVLRPLGVRVSETEGSNGNVQPNADKEFKRRW